MVFAVFEMLKYKYLLPNPGLCDGYFVFEQSSPGRLFVFPCWDWNVRSPGGATEERTGESGQKFEWSWQETTLCQSQYFLP